MIQDTIAAIATPVGTAGVGVIRVSGADALGVACRVFRGANDLPSHTAHHGALVDPVTGEPIDDVVLTVFRAPASYTGENVVEISCHGSIVILKNALNAAINAGSRLAEPGEFTKRAFLNGKLDLAQAEAVNDLIRSRTDEARRVALRQLDGAFSARVRGVNKTILGVIAAVEAAIDFPDDVDDPDPDWLRREIVSARESLSEMISTFSTGRIYREGLRLVIAGRVNVGKSSLLNALLRHARAIVTPIPGTTRDTIEESLEIHGIPIVAVDTAGLRATDDPVEKLGVELTRRSLDSADLVLLVLDATAGADAQLLSHVSKKQAILALNKIDLVSETARHEAVERLTRETGGVPPIVETCASSGDGIEALENQIAAVAASTSLRAESVLVSNARHQRLLISAGESLGHALVTLDTGEPIDLLTPDLMAARDALGQITGETAAEDLLDTIFSEFCIGK